MQDALLSAPKGRRMQHIIVKRLIGKQSRANEIVAMPLESVFMFRERELRAKIRIGIRMRKRNISQFNHVHWKRDNTTTEKANKRTHDVHIRRMIARTGECVFTLPSAWTHEYAYLRVV